MRRVVEAHDTAIEEHIVLAQMGDAARRGPEVDVASRVHGHLHPRGDDEGQGEAVGDDYLGRTGAFDYPVHGAINPGEKHAFGFRAGDAISVIQAVSRLRRSDRPARQPRLGFSPGLAEAPFTQIGRGLGAHTKRGGDDCRCLGGPQQIRRVDLDWPDILERRLQARGDQAGLSTTVVRQALSYQPPTNPST